jgi:hypothetical protein
VLESLNEIAEREVEKIIGDSFGLVNDFYLLCGIILGNGKR